MVSQPLLGTRFRVSLKQACDRRPRGASAEGLPPWTSGRARVALGQSRASRMAPLGGRSAAPRPHAPCARGVSAIDARVAFVAITHPGRHDVMAAAWNGWLRLAAGRVVIVSDAADPRFPVVVARDTRLTSKTILGLRTLLERMDDSVKWFARVDDDTAMNVTALGDALSMFGNPAGRRLYTGGCCNSPAPSDAGRGCGTALDCGSMLPNVYACSNGGAVLSREALRLYAAHADTCPRFGLTDPQGPSRADPDDLNIGQCLLRASNGSTECTLPWPGRESGRDGARPWFTPFRTWSPNATNPNFLALHHVSRAGHKRVYRALCGDAPGPTPPAAGLSARRSAPRSAHGGGRAGGSRGGRGAMRDHVQGARGAGRVAVKHAQT